MGGYSQLAQEYPGHHYIHVSKNRDFCHAGFRTIVPLGIANARLMPHTHGSKVQPTTY